MPYATNYKQFCQRRLTLIFLLFALAALSGCDKITAMIQPTPSAPGAYTPGQPVDRAGLEQAFRSANYAQAESMATAYVKQSNLTRPDQAAGLRILSLSALRNQHGGVAVAALENWRGLEPGVDEGQEWRSAFFEAAAQLPPAESAGLMQKIQADSSRPQTLRWDAAAFGAEQEWRSGNHQSALDKLAVLYGSAGTHPTRGKAYQAEMEQRLFNNLHGISPYELEKLSAQINTGNVKTYPFALARLESARRYAMDPRTKPLGQEMVDALKPGLLLADPNIVSQWDSVSGPATTAALPAGGQTIVLALPMSGQYGSVSKRIVKGAEVACAEFSAAGSAVNLQVIDTDKPGWVESLAALPDTAIAVGGPLRSSDYSALKTGGAFAKRAVFAFLPRTESGDEGVASWRFFTSPEDQTDAALRFTSSLGINTYAILYPEENYGKRMAEIFTARAPIFGGTVTAQGSYPAQHQDGWIKRVGSFLSGSRGTGHRAIFLPGAWEDMDTLVPSLFYYKETRQVLIGTSIWERSLSSQRFVDARYYTLAVFPGAWDPQGTAPAAEKLRLAMGAEGQNAADYWNGLGYDFARFAATLNLAPGWNPASLNSALASSHGIAWSSAPMRWDASGKNKQELFMFTPAANGFAPLDPAAFKEAYTQAMGGK